MFTRRHRELSTTSVPSARSISAAIFVILVLTAVSATAVTIERTEMVRISALHRIEDDFYAIASSSVHSEGYIDGDFVAFTNDFSCNGEVTGSVSACAYKVVLDGEITGSARALGFSIEDEAEVGRSLVAIGNEIHLGTRSLVNRDVFARGGSVVLEGRVAGNVDIVATQIEIRGNHYGNLSLTAEKITIAPPAVIRGDIRFNENAELVIDSLGGAKVLGNVVPVKASEVQTTKEKRSWYEPVIMAVARILAGFLFGLLLIFLFRRYALESCLQLRQRPALAAAAGFMTLLACLVCTVILILAVVCLVVSWYLVSSDAAVIAALMAIFSIVMLPVTIFAGVSGGILFYAGKITAAMVLGYTLVRLFKMTPSELGKWQLLLGLAVLSALCSLPYFGTALLIVACIMGAGGIVLAVRRCRPIENVVTAVTPPPPIKPATNSGPPVSQ